MELLKIISIVLLISFLLSCNNTGKIRQYYVYVKNGKGWDYSSTTINCDSVKLFSISHARIYIDGIATDVFGDRIMISNTY